MAYGLGGLILLLLATIVVGGSFDRGGVPFGLENQRQLLVLPTRAAVESVRGAWADRWGDVLAGGVVALVGIVVVSLGI